MNARREGFTLVELLVVITIAGIVLTAVYQTLTTQERSVRQSYALIGIQNTTRTAIEVLTSELREISATDGDLVLADSIAIRFRGMRKGGVVCANDPSFNWVDVAEIGSPFVSGDSILLFSDGPNITSGIDDSWIVRQINSVGSTTNCAGNPVSTSVRRLTLATPATDVIPGALVRSFVHLGYRLVDVGGEGQIFMMSGADSVPLVEDLTTIANQGLRFRYTDSLGVAVPVANLTTAATRNTVARIQVKVRGIMVGGQTGSNRMVSDSLVSTIYLRGNRKLR